MICIIHWNKNKNSTSENQCARDRKGQKVIRLQQLSVYHNWLYILYNWFILGILQYLVWWMKLFRFCTRSISILKQAWAELSQTQSNEVGNWIFKNSNVNKIALFLCNSHIEFRLRLRLSGVWDWGWGWGWGWGWDYVELNFSWSWV